MTVQHSVSQQVSTLDELMNNAVDLPVDNQNQLLMMAKAMQYTRNCMTQKNLVEQGNTLPSPSQK